jgi:hypothetical protein
MQFFSISNGIKSRMTRSADEWRNVKFILTCRRTCRRQWDDNIEMELKEMKCVTVDWMKLVHDKSQ